MENRLRLAVLVHDLADPIAFRNSFCYNVANVTVEDSSLYRDVSIISRDVDFCVCCANS